MRVNWIEFLLTEVLALGPGNKIASILQDGFSGNPIYECMHALI